VVIDVGSSTTKVGFAGQEHPERIFSSVRCASFIMIVHTCRAETLA
jgi:hypothetical protein